MRCYSYKFLISTFRNHLPYQNASSPDKRLISFTSFKGQTCVIPCFSWSSSLCHQRLSSSTGRGGKGGLDFQYFDREGREQSSESRRAPPQSACRQLLVIHCLDRPSTGAAWSLEQSAIEKPTFLRRLDWSLCLGSWGAAWWASFASLHSGSPVPVQSMPRAEHRHNDCLLKQLFFGAVFCSGQVVNSRPSS